MAISPPYLTSEKGPVGGRFILGAILCVGTGSVKGILGAIAKALEPGERKAADWAKRKGLGEDVYQSAWGYALEAERKMGRMLLVTPRAEGAKGIGKKKSAVVPIDSTLTLPQIGITRDESSQAQFLAALPDETFEAIKSGTLSRAQAKRDKSCDFLMMGPGKNLSTSRGFNRSSRRRDVSISLCAIPAAFQVVVFLIAVEGLSRRRMDVYSQLPESQKVNSG